MILADEPTGALDSKNARSLMEKLSGLNRYGRILKVMAQLGGGSANVL